MSNYNGHSFWFVQDKVSPDVIQGFTKTCARNDCRVSFRMGETTLAGCGDHYDKQGSLIINNRNQFTGTICCSQCWRSGVVNNHGEMLEEILPPRSES